MKTIRAAIAAALVLGLLSPAAEAGAGQTSLDFLRLDVGPREVGMAGSGTGLGGDVYSMAQNPAWLARMNSREIGASNVLWMQGINYQDVMYAQPTAYGAFGARFENLNYGSIASYDDGGTSQGNISAGDELLGGSYAKNFPEQRLSLGASLKIAQESIAGVTARTELLDAGAAWFPWHEGSLERLSFGLAVLNVGPAVKFDTVSEPLPRTINFGTAMRFLDDRAAVALDVDEPSGQSLEMKLGGEFWVHPQFAIRGGFQTGPTGPGLQAGFGVKFGQARIDYAFAPMGDLGLTHHIGMTFRFGKVGQSAFDEGVKLMRANEPAEAILKFEQALKEDPDHPEAGEWLIRAHRRIVQEVNQEAK